MHTLTAIELRDKFLSGELSASEIADHFLKRIQKYDDKLGAFLSVRKNAVRQEAELLDLKRKAGKRLGKLAAVPIALKDNIYVKDELTTCASKFLENYRAPFESTVARLLRQEDALLIGKTNMDEFAMGSSTENSAFQLTRNPWNLNCSPGGSSGGSAAAVAAHLAPIALGTDTGGSIRQPASFCGITGFMPTYGRIPHYGLVPLAPSMDHIGPFANSTADAALIMEVLDGTRELNLLDGCIKDIKIGVPYRFLDLLSSEMLELFKNSISRLKSLGTKIVEVDLDILMSSVPAYSILSSAEAAKSLAHFTGIHYSHRLSTTTILEEIDRFYENPEFGAEVKRRILLGTYIACDGYKNSRYNKAQSIRSAVIESFNLAFARCHLIAMPVYPTGAFEIGTKQASFDDVYTVGCNLAGIPAISVPHGLTNEGKPVGLQLTGPRNQDVLVFRAAHAFEQGIKQTTPQIKEKS